jgi:hypothetical protein
MVYGGKSATRQLVRMDFVQTEKQCPKGAYDEELLLMHDDGAEEIGARTTVNAHSYGVV